MLIKHNALNSVPYFQLDLFHFQTLDIKYVATMIQKEIFSEIQDVKKNLKPILSKETRKQSHLSNFNTLFDIARCNCFRKMNKEGRPKEDFNPGNCSCSADRKIINFNTYFDHLFDEEPIILLSEEEKLKFQQITAGNK